VGEGEMVNAHARTELKEWGEIIIVGVNRREEKM
jgi:hypothetical protein